jgi:hypothetical protein
MIAGPRHDGLAMPISLEQAQAAKKVVLRRYEALDNVTGVGITRVRGRYAVKLNLSEPAEPGVDFPPEIDGVPLKVEVTGPISTR